jgi:uncharacterized protein
MRDRLPLLVGLTLLAVAVALGAWFVGDGIRARNGTDVITVTGSAKERIVSDYVVWDASLTSQHRSAPDAARELARWTARVRGFFRAQGVTPGELTVQPIFTETPGTVADDGTKVTGYRLTRTFEVRSARVDAVSRLAESTSALLAQGIPLAADAPQYVYTKLPSLRPRLLAEATKDAQRRARVLVEASGARLGKLRDVAVGVFQVTAPNSTDVSDYGTYDTTTLQKDVSSVVNVTFTLR